MRAWRGGVAGLLVGLCVMANGVAEARVVAKIDLNGQEMQVFVDGKLKHAWSIASGRRGYETPTGSYRPQRLEKDWYSRQYDDAPMPYTVFFSGGYAIHGGYGRMGRPASHGCIRLNTSNAATFYNLVSSYGPGKTKIVIDD